MSDTNMIELCIKEARTNLKLFSTADSAEAQLAALRADNEQLRERVGELEAAIVWALGYTDFRARKDGEGSYYWRKELSERAGITHEEAEAIAAALEGAKQ